MPGSNANGMGSISSGAGQSTHDTLVFVSGLSRYCGTMVLVVSETPVSDTLELFLCYN